jgi:hypothetical protein
MLVLKIDDVLPAQAPMRELRAIERDAKLLDADMLLAITDIANPVSSGFIYRWKKNKKKNRGLTLTLKGEDE